MKKSFKFQFFTVITILLLAVYSCESNVPEPSVITEESVWKTDQEALATANAVYPPLQRLSSSYSFLLESATENTISFEGADDQAGPLVSLFQTDVNNWYPTKIFNYLYVSIGEANRTVAKADSSYAGGTLTQATIDLASARAKFVRGLDYLYLTQLWGEVPIILSTQSSQSELTTRRSIDQVYTQIVKDLTEAEQDLPRYDAIRSNPSKGAANAILARTYLSWASKPLSQNEVAAIADSRTDPAQVSWDRDKLLKAVEHADRVISSGNYGLEANFEDIFGVSAENRSKEHIFTIHHDGDNLGDAQGNHQTHCPFTFRFDLYQDTHIGPADVTLLNRWSDNDKRKRYSLLTQLSNQDEPLVGSPKSATDYKSYNFEYPATSPRFGKYIHRNPSFHTVAPGTESGQPNNINRIEIRYAEVLLIKAEALLHLGKAVEATEVINELRNRAGVVPISLLTQETLEDEWTLELFFEQKHWLNLVRWRKLIGTVLTETPKFEYYKPVYRSVEAQIAQFGPEKDGSQAGSVKTNYPFFAKVNKHLHSKTENVKGKFYRFPIPKGLSGNTLGIDQNPGY